MLHPHVSSGGRYPVLRSVAILWLVGAVLSCIGGLIQAVAAVAGMQQWQMVPTSTNMSGRIMGFFIWLAATFFTVVFMVAVAELIKLAIDIEHNTRLGALAASASGASVTDPKNGAPGRIFTSDEETAEGALIRGH